ncbi:MAG: DUF4255 domain-containing protein [Candidatus Korobacteraceae bacterium]
MSNSLAIAAVTATLQSILLQAVTAETDLSDTVVTIQPLDKARGAINSNQLNLFLYQILPNAAWRNWDIPSQVKQGESAVPPLALNLYYLLTAFGRDNDANQPFGHELLGKAMSALYDHALLGADEIRNATAANLALSDLDKQVERVRITLQPLSVEEISKLWTGFATQYRLSSAYEVAVALIDSTQPVKTPLPILTRGRQDSGIFSQADLIPPFPALDTVAPPNQQLSVRLGETLTLTGHDLDGSNQGVSFLHPLWTAPIELPPATATATQATVGIPNNPASWPAGFYAVEFLVQRPNDTFRRTSNQLTFSLAPVITIAPQSAPAGSVTYTVTCKPDILPQQRASLLLGDLEILADPHPSQINTLTFQATNVAAGNYFVRLRVDGVDSILVNRTVTPPLFDATQKVTVT